MSCRLPPSLEEVALDAFSLTKWYLDVVDDEGRSAIAYWSEIAWGPLSLGWESVSLRGASGPAVHRSRPARSAAPCRAAGQIAWESGALGCRVTCDPWCPSFRARLLDIPGGVLDWCCEVPGGQATADAGDGCVVRGTGYAERLVLTLLPWRLPISELRWGRWISPATRRSIVWIGWRGDHPLTLVLDCGEPAEAAVVDDGVVRFGSARAGGAGVLRLDRPETLHARRLSDILQGVRPLSRRLPRAWQAVEDRKTRSRGVLNAGQAAPDTGWAIHELVRFP
ncbi:MAG TPA: hypothetical protein VK911_13810 [Vicinamibacterales bacterium]|nr:hypothetical protein [Vicinamibacterales bacterium]